MFLGKLAFDLNLQLTFYRHIINCGFESVGIVHRVEFQYESLSTKSKLTRVRGGAEDECNNNDNL